MYLVGFRASLAYLRVTGGLPYCLPWLPLGFLSTFVVALLFAVYWLGSQRPPKLWLFFGYKQGFPWSRIVSTHVTALA